MTQNPFRQVYTNTRAASVRVEIVRATVPFGACQGYSVGSKAGPRALRLPRVVLGQKRKGGLPIGCRVMRY